MNLKRYIDMSVRREVRKYFRDKPNNSPDDENKRKRKPVDFDTETMRTELNTGVMHGSRDLKSVCVLFNDLFRRTSDPFFQKAYILVKSAANNVDNYQFDKASNRLNEANRYIKKQLPMKQQEIKSAGKSPSGILSMVQKIFSAWI